MATAAQETGAAPPWRCIQSASRKPSVIRSSGYT